MSDKNTQFIYLPHRINPDQTIDQLIRSIPAALPYLIHLGFMRLAEPLERQRIAPKVTIRQAAETLPFNLETLLVELEQLADEAATDTTIPRPHPTPAQKGRP